VCHSFIDVKPYGHMLYNVLYTANMISLISTVCSNRSVF